MNEQILALQEECRDANALLSLSGDHRIESYAGEKFTNEIRETIMELLAMNVSMNRIDSVIRTVLRNLCGRTVERLNT